MKQKGKFLLLLLLSIFLLTGASRVNATVTISDWNTEVTIDPSSSAGVYDWELNGTDYLDTQWFWYRIGNGPVQSIDTLNSTVSQSCPAAVVLNYSGRDIAVQVNLMVMGSPDNTPVADLAEIVRITNKSGKTQEFNFYQFSDFDFGSSAIDDVITVQAPYNIQQSEKGWPSPGLEVSVTASNTSLSYQVGDAASLLNYIKAGNDLNGNETLLPKDDASFAWQWKKTLSNGSSFIISKNKVLNPVPIPGSMLLLLSGFLGVISIKRKRLSK